MTTHAERILTLDRQVNDAEESALAAEFELAAAHVEPDDLDIAIDWPGTVSLEVTP